MMKGKIWTMLKILMVQQLLSSLVPVLCVTKSAGVFGFFYCVQQMAVDPDALAVGFVEHYYSTFDGNRAGLATLYEEESMSTFEGQKIKGAQNIVNKLTSLPFQHCHHSITTVDCQPSGINGGMLVFVTGSLQLAGEQHALKFSQMFHLIPTPHGSYYVLNDVFRLNYA